MRLEKRPPGKILQTWTSASEATPRMPRSSFVPPMTRRQCVPCETVSTLHAAGSLLVVSTPALTRPTRSRWVLAAPESITAMRTPCPRQCGGSSARPISCWPQPMSWLSGKRGNVAESGCTGTMLTASGTSSGRSTNTLHGCCSEARDRRRARLHRYNVDGVGNEFRLLDVDVPVVRLRVDVDGADRRGRLAAHGDRHAPVRAGRTLPRQETAEEEHLGR